MVESGSRGGVGENNGHVAAPVMPFLDSANEECQICRVQCRALEGITKFHVEYIL